MLRGHLQPICRCIIRRLCTHWNFERLNLKSSLKSKKIGVLVVGMHRSGTSVTAKLLNFLGATLPGNLMPPHSEINPKGFWESYDIASLNDVLLSNHQSRWDDVLSIPLDDKDQPSSQSFENKAIDLINSDFSDTGLFVIKDPRIGRLLPYWLRVFDRMSIEPRIIIPVRHPMEVAASLKRRDKFHVDKSVYLWLRHLVDVEIASRNVRRSFVLYDDLLNDWKGTANKLSDELGIAWPNSPNTVKSKVDAFLDVQLRHHHRKSFRPKRDDLIANLAKELYSIIRLDEKKISSLSELIDKGLSPSENLLSPILRDITQRYERKEQVLNETKVMAHQFESKMSATCNMLDERDGELAETRNQFSKLSDEFEAKAIHVNQLLTEKSNVESRIRSISKKICYAIASTDSANKKRKAMSQHAEDSLFTQPSIEHLEEKTARIVSLSQVNNSHLLEATSKLISADNAIRSLLYAQKSSSHFSSVFRKKNRNVQLLENSQLFDATFYVSSHMEVLTSGMTPTEHYLNVGVTKGWDPHPLFCNNWYLMQNRDVAQSGMNPLIHFISCGASEGRAPHPLFDIKLYLTIYPQVANSEMNPLEHYLNVGGHAGFRPHWLFDGRAYLDAYPEVRKMGGNPLSHYLQFGYLNNYRPHWAFDPIFYLTNNPEVAFSGISPLVHFITQGANLRLNPSEDFDFSGYIEQHPFLEYNDENPFIYYVRNCDYKSVFNPPDEVNDEIHAPPPEAPVQIIEHGQPLSVFMDFLYDEFGEAVRTELIARMQRFHLPFTSEKITPNPSEHEVTEWINEIGSLSEALINREQPDVSIVIPTFNQLPFTLACIHSVLSSKTRYSFEIIIADDCSTDSTTEIFSQGVGHIKHVQTEENQGFIRNCNNAARQAIGRYLVLLNNDTIVLPGWLDELIEPMETHSDIGLTGSKLLYPDGKLQESGGIIFSDGSGWNYGRTDDPRKPQYCYMRDADYVSGASIALRTAFWRTKGGFDEQYSVAYYEDTDMAFRVRQAGLRVVVQPLSQLIHFEGISSGTDINAGAKQYQVTNGAIFREKWDTALSGYGQCDPDKLPVDRTAQGRILVIDACTPTPDRDSGSMDTYQYLRILKSFGLHVTFAPENLTHFGKYTEDLQRLGVETLYAPYWMSFEEMLKKLGHTFDIVLVYRAPIAALFLPLLREHAPQAKIIFDTVDLHFLREEREAELTGDPKKIQSAANTRKTELKIIEDTDATIVLSSHEMTLLQNLLPHANIFEIPIVRDIPGPGTLGFSQRQDIVFIGGFKHTPNVDAVKWFVGEVWPLLRENGFDGNFIIVGSDMTPEITNLNHDNIEVRGFVPDIQDVFNTCRISVAPLRYGAGLKGKVISSLSFGVPVVATPVAVEGGGFIHGQNVLVAGTPEEFSDSILKLYRDQSLWEKLSRNGVEHCISSFSVAAVSTKLSDLINNVAPNLKLNKPH